jgi:hypothetical protein
VHDCSNKRVLVDVGELGEHRVLFFDTVAIELGELGAAACLAIS